jgi:hypothetical protein
MILLLGCGGFSYADEKYGCAFYAAKEADLISETDCLMYFENRCDPQTGSDATLSERVLSRAGYNEDRLGYLFSNAGVFYFTRDGLVRKALIYDNGPDYFQEGLARTRWKGKIGFFDKKLSIVIPPQFDFAFPYRNGIAMVCNGCQQEKQGEHRAVVGGQWGAINLKGEIKYPLKYSKSELTKKLYP